MALCCLLTGSLLDTQTVHLHPIQKQRVMHPSITQQRKEHLHLVLVMGHHSEKMTFPNAWGPAQQH
jgi:hypothetical protein